MAEDKWNKAPSSLLDRGDKDLGMGEQKRQTQDVQKEKPRPEIQVDFKGMKTISPDKTEIHLYMKFSDSNFTEKGLIMAVMSLLNQRSPWISAERFYEILAQSSDSYPRNDPSIQ